MKPLSEVAPGLLVIQILIQAVWETFPKIPGSTTKVERKLQKVKAFN